MQIYWGELGPRGESCLEAGQRAGRRVGEALDSQRNLPAPTQPPSAAASSLSPARQGWGLAREGRWRWPGQRNSFHFPPAAGNGFQELGSSAARMPPGGTGIARCNFFVGPSGETEAGEGLVEPEADLGLEMLQWWPLQ